MSQNAPAQVATVAAKKKPLFDFETPGEKQRAMLALFGLFFILPMAYMSYMLGLILFLNETMALVVGFSAMMVTGGFLGFLVITIDKAVQQVTIKVVPKE